MQFGGTIIEPIDASSCRVTYTVASDPKGSLPNWVVAIAAIAQPLCVALIRDYMVKNKTRLMPLLPQVRCDTCLLCIALAYATRRIAG